MKNFVASACFVRFGDRCPNDRQRIWAWFVACVLGTLAVMVAMPTHAANLSAGVEPKGWSQTCEQFSPRRFMLSTIASSNPELTFKASNRGDAERWRRQLREKLIKLLGGFPSQSCPLQARTTEVRELVTYADHGRPVRYRREAIIFQSRVDLPVFAYFLVPLSASNTGKVAKGVRLPCIICLPGHGSKVDDVIGVNADGSLRRGWEGYQQDFGLQ